MIKEQELKIETQKTNEQIFKDKIFDLEKQLKESNHKLELQKLDHEKEVSCLKSKLNKKNSELVKQMENFIMNKLDLDAYNLTSDDFRNSHHESESDKIRSKSNDDCKNKQAKCHPLVPRLDFQKIFDWRERVNNDNVIMIKISESRILGEDEIDKELDDENGIESNNKRYFKKGSPLIISKRRVASLGERKQMIISALNMAYSDDGEGEDE